MEKLKYMKNSKWCRVIAAALCVMLVLGMIFQVNLFSTAEEKEKTVREETIEGIQRNADTSTIDNWKEYFGENTSQAGKVWTDKSVFDVDQPNGITDLKRDNPENFLIGLSALSSTKSVDKMMPTPMDIMLVLDISLSMDQSGSVQAMIDAANSTIDSLQSLNENNRIGVVLYSGSSSGMSGNDTAVALLPLGRYKGKSENEKNLYLNFETDSKLIKIVNGVEKVDGGEFDANASVKVSGMTYIQNGIYKAWEQLNNVPKNDTIIGGIKRIPSIILMSDGNPTAVTNDYSNVGNATIDVGSQSSDERLVFATQLTASWVTAKMEEHYGRSGLFYTVGLGLNSASTSQALGVLSPSEHTNEFLDESWKTFFGSSVSDSETYVLEPDKSITITKNDDLIKSRFYVDEFFSAQNSSDLIDAFKKIVEKITEQSQYFPTEVEEGKENYSGYITFNDEIGKYMEIKSLKGVVYSNELYNGDKFANTILENYKNDTLNTDNELINNFIVSLEERFEIEKSVAKSLVISAIKDGQIARENSKNYISWYAAADGAYLDFCSESAQSPPENAKYINKSYFYFGESVGTTRNEDMMYLSICLQTDLETQVQNLIVKIPSTLIPIVKYEVTSGKNEGEDITVKKDASPVSVFYEVGLKDEIKKDNIDSNLLDENGEISFYTNEWKQDSESTALTEVNFTPSRENDYYYYQSNAVLYYKTEDNHYEKYNEETNPVDTKKTFYYEKEIYNTNNSNTAHEMIEIPKSVLENAKKQNEGWYLPFGTVKVSDFSEIKKENNISQSVDYIIQEYGNTISEKRPLDIGGGISILGRLGNNGNIHVSTGKAQISKTVKGEESDLQKDFEFTIQLTDSNGKALEGKYTYIKNGEKGSIGTEEKFLLKHNETIEIIGLPISSNISVSEKEETDYKTSVSINGAEEILENEGSIKIASDSPNSIEFINTYSPKTMQFRFLKVDGRTVGDLDDVVYLEGAKFKLYRRVDSTQSVSQENSLLTNEPELSNWELIEGEKISSGEYASVEYSALETGEYCLEETEAPTGYQKPEGKWRIMINAETNEIEITSIGNVPAIVYIDGTPAITNYRPVDLPLTGGRGILGFMVTGTIIMGGAIMFSIHLVLQKKRGKI